MSSISDLIKSPQTVIVDVRTPEEFMGGHVAGSINIPIAAIAGKLDELKTMTPLVLCCASGGRSAQAAMYLKQNGVACTDGGAWTNVNYYKNN